MPSRAMMKSALGAAVQPVLDGRCSVGIIGPLPEIPNTLTSERFSGISFLMVAARGHPLTLHKGKIPKEALSKHNQIGPHRPVGSIRWARAGRYVAHHMASR